MNGKKARFFAWLLTTSLSMQLFALPALAGEPEKEPAVAASSEKETEKEPVVAAFSEEETEKEPVIAALSVEETSDERIGKDKDDVGLAVKESEGADAVEEREEEPPEVRIAETEEDLDETEGALLQSLDPDTITEEAVYASLLELKEDYPEGLEWETDENTDAVNSSSFQNIIAFRLYSAFFPARIVGYQFSRLRAGDIFRMNDISYIVLQKDEDLLTCVTVRNAKVTWEACFTAEELEGNIDSFITYYPSEDDTEIFTLTLTSNYPAGENESISDSYEEGELVILQEQPWLYPDYIFAGWASDPYAQEPEYESGCGIRMEEDVTLYAVWKRKDNRVLTMDQMDTLIPVSVTEEGFYYTFVPEETAHYYFRTRGIHQVALEIKCDEITYHVSEMDMEKGKEYRINLSVRDSGNGEFDFWFSQKAWTEEVPADLEPDHVLQRILAEKEQYPDGLMAYSEYADGSGFITYLTECGFGSSGAETYQLETLDQLLPGCVLCNTGSGGNAVVLRASKDKVKVAEVQNGVICWEKEYSASAALKKYDSFLDYYPAEHRGESCTVRFYDADARQTLWSRDYVKGFCPQISDTIPKKDDAEFIGWAENPEGAGTIYQPGDFIRLDHDTTLYAIWTVEDILILENKDVDRLLITPPNSWSIEAKYRFIPDQTGIYTFTSYAEGVDTVICITDAEDQEIDSDDDGGEQLNFSLALELTAGKTYYLILKTYRDDAVTYRFRFTREVREPVNPFTDLDRNRFYYDAVLWAVENQITSGKTAATFAPDDNCTRAQVVTFLWRAYGSPEPVETKNPFVDVTAGTPFYKAILWAREKGITSGTDATHFKPDDPVTRAQFVTFLWRANGTPEPADVRNPFADVPSGGPFFKAILWAKEKGITQGTDAAHFSPNTICTRGQVVTFLYRGQ